MKLLFAFAFFLWKNKSTLKYQYRLAVDNRSGCGFVLWVNSTSEKHKCNNSVDVFAFIVTAIRAGQACSLISAGPDSGGWKKNMQV